MIEGWSEDNLRMLKTIDCICHAKRLMYSVGVTPEQCLIIVSSNIKTIDWQTGIQQSLYDALEMTLHHLEGVSDNASA